MNSLNRTLRENNGDFRQEGSLQQSHTQTSEQQRTPNTQMLSSKSQKPSGTTQPSGVPTTTVKPKINLSNIDSN